MDFDTLKDVLAALEHHGVRYVIFGAAALNVHGLARFTEDLDIFVAPDRENVERLKNAQRSVFDDPHIDEISSDDLQARIRPSSTSRPTGSFTSTSWSGSATRSGSTIWRPHDSRSSPLRYPSPLRVLCTG